MPESFYAPIAQFWIEHRPSPVSAGQVLKKAQVEGSSPSRSTLSLMCGGTKFLGYSQAGKAVASEAIIPSFEPRYPNELAEPASIIKLHGFKVLK